MFRTYIAKANKNVDKASSYWEKGKLRERSTRVSLAVLAKVGPNTDERKKILRQAKSELFASLANYRIAGGYENIRVLVDQACQVELSLSVSEQVDIDLFKAWSMLARGLQDEAEVKAKRILEVCKDKGLREHRGKASKILATVTDLRTNAVVFGDEA